MREATQAVADRLRADWTHLSVDPERTAVEALGVVNDILVLPLHTTVANLDARVQVLQELVHGDGGVVAALVGILTEISETCAHTCDGGGDWEGCGPCTAAYGIPQIAMVQQAMEGAPYPQKGGRRSGASGSRDLGAAPGGHGDSEDADLE
jgi:hypothetical protein